MVRVSVAFFILAQALGNVDMRANITAFDATGDIVPIDVDGDGSPYSLWYAHEGCFHPVSFDLQYGRHILMT